jgi:amidase
MTDTPLWQLGAAALAARTRAGDVTAEAAVGAAVARMRAVNPRLNAVVVDTGDAALERARALDRARAAGAVPGPLHGVPVTIKINVDQAGQATSNGIPALKDFIAAADAPLVARLQEAGAVVIGRTNTPEFSFRADTDNPLHGRTHNPWGRHVSAGGSSGGAGAAVMAGMGALAHGNDIGGSLRFPASANGAVTVKPGLGRVAAWNPSQTAERGLLAQLMSVQGLIVREAADLHLAMPVIIAPDPRDPWHVPLPWRGAPVERPIRVGWTEATWGFDLHPDVAAALRAARAALADAGYAVERIDPPAMPEAAVEGYRALMTEVSHLLGPDIDRLGSDTLKAIFVQNYAMAPPWGMDDYLRALARRTGYARAWSVLLERYPLVLTPFLPQPFFTPGRDAEGAEGLREALGSALWSYAMNYLGLPAGNLPARLAEVPGRGPVPVGVQIVGRRWREDLIVDAMVAVEDRLGRLAPELWRRMG